MVYKLAGDCMRSMWVSFFKAHIKMLFRPLCFLMTLYCLFT